MTICTVLSGVVVPLIVEVNNNEDKTSLVTLVMDVAIVVKFVELAFKDTAVICSKTFSGTGNEVGAIVGFRDGRHVVGIQDGLAVVTDLVGEIVVGNNVFDAEGMTVGILVGNLDVGVIVGSIDGMADDGKIVNGIVGEAAMPKTGDFVVGSIEGIVVKMEGVGLFVV